MYFDYRKDDCIIGFAKLTPIIGYAEHFVVHHTYQIYSLGLMRAKAVGSKNRSETEPDGVKMINSMIRN
jgi:hypothetical protein